MRKVRVARQVPESFLCFPFGPVRPAGCCPVTRGGTAPSRRPTLAHSYAADQRREPCAAGATPLRLGQLLEPLGEPVELPLAGESGGLTPTRFLIAHIRQRRLGVHRRDGAIEAQPVGDLREAAGRERALERAVLAQDRG